MKPTIEQIEEAIVKQKELAGDYFAGWYEEEISFALRFTKKMMGEPSDKMRAAASREGKRFVYRCPPYTTTFKAMVNQAIKEVEDV